MTAPATIARDRVTKWDRARLDAPDAAQQVMRSFGISIVEASAIINRERGRRS